MARPPIRRCSRKIRRSCRKNCRSAPKKPARSWKPTRPRVALRPIRPRNRQTPFLGVVEFRVDIEDHAPEREHPVAYDLPDLEFCGARFNHGFVDRPGLWPMLGAFPRINVCAGRPLDRHTMEIT